MRRTAKKIPIFLEIEEVKALLRAARKPRDHLIVHLLYKTGLRCHELTSLCVEHIDFENDQLLVVSGKGDKDRYVDIDLALKTELLDYIAANELGLEGVLIRSPMRRGHKTARTVKRQGYRMEGGHRVGKNIKDITLAPGQMSDRQIHRIITGLVKKAGIKKAKSVSVHTLRHTYACQSLRAGRDITIISKQMGHSNISTTMVYLEAIRGRQYVKEAIQSHPLPSIKEE